MQERGRIRSFAMGIILVQAAAGLCEDLVPSTQFEFGAAAWYFEYKEPGLMTEKGPFVGFQASYTYRGPLGAALEDALLRAEVRAGFGKVDYDGQLMDGTPYSYKGIDDVLIEPRFLVGRDFAIAAVRVTPYVGAGYRRLDDFEIHDPAGYNRTSNYLYSPIGLETWQPMRGPWQIGGIIEYDLFWLGRQDTWLFDQPLRNDQHSGYGLRSSIRFIREGDQYNLVLEPYVVYWNVKTSDVDYGPDDQGYVEPANHSIECGVRVGLRY
jgi:hypothetical protein